MFSFIYKFLEPARKEKVATFKMLFESCISSLWYDLLPVFTLPYLTSLVLAKEFEKVKIFCLEILAVYIFLWILNLGIRRWDMEAKYIYEKYINDSYREGIILKNNLEVEQIGTGKIQSILQKGIFAWANVNWQVLYQAPKTVMILGSGTYITLNLGLSYFFLFIILFCISITGYVVLKRKKLAYDDRVQEEENKLNDNSVRVIMSRGEIVNSGKVRYEVNKLGNYISKIQKIYGDSSTLDFLSDLFISANGILLPFIGVYLALTLSGGENLDVELIPAFLYFCARFSSLLYHVSWIFTLIIDEYPKITRLWKFIDNIPEVKNYYSGKEFIHGDGSISLKNISFEYRQKDLGLSQNVVLNEEEKEKLEDKKTVLTDFSLEIKGGERVALIGRSGSGKTTIVKLISGYMHPTKGDVFIDGQNLKNTSLFSFYKYLGYLTQEPSVFDGTIKENMLYAAKEKVKDQDIFEALKKAQCDFIFKLKKGIHTNIGEKGVRLSGGERQRLAIAKLFLKNPEIIILDEPTSALDSFSEELVTKALEELFMGRTVIIIAHRLQTVKNADRILLLEGGKIKEEGDHEFLYNQKGQYFEMVNMQSVS
jgi:ABC-type multidrug transport system fused ATPase/permease subunit